jgi:hypothetical protein
MKLAWILAVAALLPTVAAGQTSDQNYCNALAQKYQAYVGNMSVGRSPNPGTLDAQVAIEQCKAGNTAAAIPVLEKKLRDARVDLPPRN